MMLTDHEETCACRSENISKADYLSTKKQPKSVTTEKKKESSKEKRKDDTTLLFPNDIITQKEKNIKKEKETAYPFDAFWNLYDKKVGKKEKIAAKWDRICERDRAAIFEYVPRYKDAQPDKRFRKNPETFLNNEGWKDEIIPARPTVSSGKIGIDVNKYWE